MSRVLLPFSLFTAIFACALALRGNNHGLEDPYAGRYTVVNAAKDTLPPLRDRQGSFLMDSTNRNPFDLQDPGSIEQTVEYDPETGQYIIQEKIGEFDFRPPTYMSFEEYQEYRKEQQEREYFNELAGLGGGEDGQSAVDPFAKFDVESSLLDRLFGGSTVDIRPQGNIDLTFGVDFQTVENPILPERQRRNGGFDFDMDIRLDVTGQIGKKLSLSTQYNTNATFDFDNQIKLNYNSDLEDAFSEDAIVKRVDAGNVSLPIRGSLIKGAQSLFGFITELQFGKLRLTAVASQQQSERSSIQIQGGGQVQEFELKADDYDENRHFFLSHYNRETFERNLQNLPQIRSLFKLENIEVWITNDRNEVDNVRDIVAFSDLGEPTRLVNPDAIPPFANPPFREIGGGRALPDNDANPLYDRLINTPGVREIDQAVSILQSEEFGLQQARDFEKVSARKLKPSEYTVHPQLGFISVNVNVQPDQVVGVAFQYSYNGETYKVGELAQNSENTRPDSSLNVLFVKMLKSTTQRTDVPTWDLMMKNVYSIGAFQVNREDFRLDVFYEDPGEGNKRFLPETNLAGQPLLRVFNLDNLNVQGDPQPDGVFDFVPGVTINPQNGRIMFPVLEPFGSTLAEQITTDELEDRFVYQELYDQTLFQAQEFPEKNRYTIKGEFKSSVSSEISLGAFNIPPGSVRVSAGGQVLREGVDYEVDYNTGRVKILNDAILNSGVPINVDFEDNTVFGFQLKSMFGLRADYEVDENFNIGGTFLNLSERPFTQKVNIGEDPINNSIYGLDLNMSRDAPWLTRAVDAIPLLSTKEPSSISVSAEAAVLSPGHSRAINQGVNDEGGVVYIDDFEGTASSFDLRQPVNRWTLASVPQNDGENNNPLFPEANLVNDIRSGANRARLNWYRIDDNARQNFDDENIYTSRVPQQEVFPNEDIPPTRSPNVRTLDLTFYPGQRGPYNFDVPDGYPGFSRGTSFIGDSMVLRDPTTRWGGIMRALETNDFQSANIEFLEFWALSPFQDPSDPGGPSPDFREKEGDLYIELGNISEDLLRDSRKFFENGLPGPANPDRRVDTTNWSVVPIAQQITQAFDNDEATRELQDVGFDGLDNDAERQKFSDFINAIAAVNPVAAERIANDPANDDFRYYLDNSFGSEDGVFERYRNFNNPQGNSQPNQGGARVNSATNIPDAEDLNRDNTLNETESYFQYRIPLRADPASPREVDPTVTNYITDRREDPRSGRIWYRFRIPLRTEDKVSVGGIRDFRSIRFIRMYLRGFQQPITLRFASFELVRNTWRRYTQDLSPDKPSCTVPPEFNIDVVNIERNSDRMPFNYVIPPDIQRETTPNNVFNNLQNEQSLSLRTRELCDGEERAVFKNLGLDIRLYERLKMFVHAEELDNQEIDPGEATLFIRLGSDFKNNYYEYEVPLTMSDPDNLPANSVSEAYRDEVWRPENTFDFALEELTQAKLDRNDQGFPLGDEFVQLVNPDDPTISPRIKVRGNPNLGFSKVAMVGIRNPEGGETLPLNMEAWVNEMRVTGLDERGGAAALGRVDMQLADFGNLTLAGNFSSIGFGALDQKVQERSREEVLGYDLATNLQMGQFFPQDWGIRLPLYMQFSKTTRTPEFDPYDLDVKLDDKLARADNGADRDSIREVTRDVNSIQSINLTNVRKERTNNQKKPKPWDIENFSFSYAYTKTEARDPIIEFDREREHTAGMDYAFSTNPVYIQPFKNLAENDKFLKLLTEFNFNPIPNSFSFSTLLNRRFGTKRYRFTGLEDRFNTFYNKSFTWDRDYNLQWDFSRSLKFSFNAFNSGVVDEPDEIDLIEDPTVEDIAKVRSDSIWNNIRDFGRTKNYRHTFNLNYNLPIRYIPFMDWVQVRAQYQGEFSWSAAALNVDSLGNVIQNRQNRQINADLNFVNLYNKIDYLREINSGGGGRSGRGNQRRRSTGRSPRDQEEEGEEQERTGPSTIEKILIRPILMLRRARFNWSEQFSTSVPGFTPFARILGMDNGFGAPGWDFIAGFQPNIRNLREDQYGTSEDWLFQAAQKGWITNNVFLNREVVQEFTQTYDGRVTLEPFADFRVDFEINRSFTDNHTEFFKDTIFNNTGEFFHTVPKDFGSLSVTYSALSTLFDDDRDEIIDLFSRFEENRSVISQRLGTGEHDNPILAREGFTKGYGRTQQDVLIPAFIAAYTGEDPNNVELDIFDTKPRLNWRLTYDGLSRLPLMRDLFQSFSLTHSYRSTLNVNSFNTGIDFLRTRNTPGGPLNELNGNFYPRLEVPQVSIQEGFNPLIAVDARLTNGMSLGVDFSKARTLGMSFVSNQLSETQTKEFVISFGYRLSNVNIGILQGGGGNQNDDQNQQGGRRRRGRGGANPNDLNINFNLSLRDDVTFNHLLDQNIVEPTRGNYSLSISPSAEYQINQQLSLRAFVDYRRNEPKTSAGFPRTTTAGGFVVRFMLN